MADSEGGGDVPENIGTGGPISQRREKVVDDDAVCTTGRCRWHHQDDAASRYGARRDENGGPEGESIGRGGEITARRSHEQRRMVDGGMERLPASSSCRGTAERGSLSDVMQIAVQKQTDLEELLVRTVIENLVAGEKTATCAASVAAHCLQLPYGPSAAGLALGTQAQVQRAGQGELLRVLEITLSTAAAAVVDAKIEGYAAAVGTLSGEDVVVARERYKRAWRMRQTAVLSKNAAEGRVVRAVARIQAAARARPARRRLAYARLAAFAAPVIRQLQAAIRLQAVARGSAARARAAALRSWARRVVLGSRRSGTEALMGAAAEGTIAVERRPGSTRLRGGGGACVGDWALVSKVIQLQEMLQERRRREEPSDSGSDSGGSWTDTDGSGGVEVGESAAASRERYRREVLEPRREARKAARAAKREAQIQRMVDAADAVARRRKEVAAVQAARAAKRARRVVVLRAVQRRQAAKARIGEASQGSAQVEPRVVVAAFALAVLSAAMWVAAVGMVATRAAAARGQLGPRHRGGGRQRRRRRQGRRRACVPDVTT